MKKPSKKGCAHAVVQPFIAFAPFVPLQFTWQPAIGSGECWDSSIPSTEMVVRSIQFVDRRLIGLVLEQGTLKIQDTRKSATRGTSIRRICLVLR